MPITIERTITLYKFDELSDEAKEKAREWYREGNLHDDWWYESTFDDAAKCGEILGIDIDQLRNNNPNAVWKRPMIYFSGFWSQGDGACFEGHYSYAKGAHKEIRKYAPQDEELHRIADCLFTIQKQAGYGLEARMYHQGPHYVHSGTMVVEVSHNRDRDPGLWEEQLRQLMRDFADWIYSQLEKEHEYQNSDEIVDDNIKSNEYTFNEHGKRED